MEGTHTVAVSAVIIPDKRFRAVDGKVANLAESIETFGQLQPVILKPNSDHLTYDLVDGLHRLTAIRDVLKTETIEAIFTDELDPITLRKIELEVNVQRIEMSWQERVQAIAELHALEMESNPNASQMSVANLAGVSQRDVSQAIQLSAALRLFPELADAKSLNQAMSRANAKAKRVLRVHDVKENIIDYETIKDKIILADSVEHIKTLPDGIFDAVITDPPFGINYDDRKARTEGGDTSYQDDAESYERLLSMAPDIYRVIKPDGWLIWFLGVSWYERAKATFRQAGFIVDEIPVIWDRSDGRSFTSRPDRYFARAYDIALHCLKGSPEIIQRGKPNIIRATPIGNTERELLVERPVELYAELIRRLTVKGETVADFFVGSGSCLAAAANMGRDFYGCELNPERRAYAITKVKAHIPDGVA